MPSSSLLKRRVSRAALLILPALSVHCTSESDRVDDICGSLEGCTGYVKKPECHDLLKDAVADERLTPAELTRCSRCLVDNNAIPNDDLSEDTKGSCETLLTNRDCDRACAMVGVVLQAKTSADARNKACSRVADACQVAPCASGIGVPGDSIAEMESNDAIVDDCIRCITQVPIPVADSGSGGSGGSGGTGGAGAGTGGSSGGAAHDFRPEICEQMIERCSSVCVGVSALDKRLTMAQTARVYCNTAHDCAQGGAPATPSEAGGAPDCLPAPFTDDCLGEFLCSRRVDDGALDRQNPHECLTCLQTSMCSENCHQSCDLLGQGGSP